MKGMLSGSPFQVSPAWKLDRNEHYDDRIISEKEKQFSVNQKYLPLFQTSKITLLTAKQLNKAICPKCKHALITIDFVFAVYEDKNFTRFKGLCATPLRYCANCHVYYAKPRLKEYFSEHIRGFPRIEYVADFSLTPFEE